MKKIIPLILLLSLAVTLFYYNKPVNSHADWIESKKLQYFKLENPVSVVRDQTNFYIAQKNLLAVYHTDESSNEVYDKTELEGFNITHIEKWQNYLLVLSDGKLYAVNLIKTESDDQPYTLIESPLFENVDTFSVCGEKFAVCCDINGETYVTYCKPSETQIFEKEKQKKLLGSTNAFALVGDDTLYYNYQNTLYATDVKNWQGPLPDVQEYPNILQMQYCDKLYFKTDSEIYVYSPDTNKCEKLFTLADIGITSGGEFFVYQNKLLICDTANDKVIEFDLESKRKTDFEISFTKIPLPASFNYGLTLTPEILFIAGGTKLYSIDLKKSEELKYFYFSGEFYTQKKDAEYLVICEVDSEYYLISGDCTALVLKEDFTDENTPTKVLLTSPTDEKAQATISNDLKTFDYPILNSDYYSFELKKEDTVTIEKTLTVNQISYALISYTDRLDQTTKKAYIPSSYLVYEQPTILEDKNFSTATTYHKQTDVFADNDLTQKIDTLDKFSDIVIYSTNNGVCHILYDGDKTGYIKQSAIAKKGDYTKRAVTVVLLLFASLTMTSVYFERKYLYNKKDTLND